MRLGLIGWYGHSNYGDERILYCIKRFFSDNDFTICNNWIDAGQRINELNQCDFILIGGGGLILRNINHYINIFRSFKKPFGFIGISIEAKHKSMEEFFELIKQRAEFILVRDTQSKRYLNNHRKVIVGPDLTFLYPFNIVSKVKEEICGLSLRDWYYWKATIYGGYYEVISRLNRRFRFIKKIYPFAKWNPNKAVKIVKKKFEVVVPIPFYFDSNVINDFDILSRNFKNTPNHFYNNFDYSIKYLVGMRFHSIVFATQCGIPFVSLSYQPKNESFCSDIGLNVLSVDLYKINALESKIDYMKNYYQQIRERLILYREKCVQDINIIFQSLSHVIDSFS